MALRCPKPVELFLVLAKTLALQRRRRTGIVASWTPGKRSILDQGSEERNDGGPQAAGGACCWQLVTFTTVLSSQSYGEFGPRLGGGNRISCIVPLLQSICGNDGEIWFATSRILPTVSVATIGSLASGVRLFVSKKARSKES